MIAHCLSGGALCLLASVPVCGRPPSLLPGSCRFSVPRFSIGTMQSLRLPTHPLWLESISPRSPEVSTLFSWLPPVADRLDGGVDVLDRGRPFPVLVLWCGTGIPCFMVSLLMVCPALRPRPCPRTSLCGPRILSPLSQRRRPSGISKFRGSITRLSISLSTLHAAFSDDDARLAYSAALPAFRRDLDPFGRRCGVSRPVAVPRLSPFDQCFCLCHSVLSFWFLFSGLSPPPCLARRHVIFSG
jgi:hypothetical protein